MVTSKPRKAALPAKYMLMRSISKHAPSGGKPPMENTRISPEATPILYSIQTLTMPQMLTSIAAPSLSFGTLILSAITPMMPMMKGANR